MDKLWCYWENFGEYIENLGNIIGNSLELMGTEFKKKKKKSSKGNKIMDPLGCILKLCHWLHENSMLETVCHNCNGSFPFV
jgi:hypothetical protein